MWNSNKSSCWRSWVRRMFGIFVWKTLMKQFIDNHSAKSFKLQARFFICLSDREFRTVNITNACIFKLSKTSRVKIDASVKENKQTKTKRRVVLHPLATSVHNVMSSEGTDYLWLMWWQSPMTRLWCESSTLFFPSERHKTLWKTLHSSHPPPSQLTR